MNSAKSYGGGERHFVDLCQALNERGHQVFAAVSPECSWAERLAFLKERVVQVPIRNSLDFMSAFRLAKICREHQIEILHAHLAKDYLPASLACRLLPKTKFFLTRHVLFPLSPYYKFALKNVVKAIAVSNAVAAELAKIFPSVRIEVIPNGIRLENWKNVDQRKKESFLSFHQIPEDAQIVGTLGELKELKGQREFVLAAQQVASEFPNAFFIVVGQDHSISKRFRLELKRLVKVLDLEDRFLFLDWVEDTTDFFSSIDVFVSPSRSESFGLAILEAMASGVAIVATQTDGALELLEDNFSAKLVPIKDAVKMASAIKEFLNDPNLRKRFGENAQKSASRFSIEQMIESLERAYSQAFQ